MTDRATGVVRGALCVLTCAAAASAQTPLVTDIRVEQEGQATVDPVIDGLIETVVGQPLSMRAVRETITHLTSLNRYEDVQVLQEPAGAGIRLRYVLVPLHPVDRLELRGMLGLPDAEVRRVVTERFGAAPPAGRAGEVAEALLALYRDRGYPAARVMPRVEETHNPDRATLALQIESGPRATIGRLDIDELDAADRRLAPADIGIRPGDAYDNTAILQALDRYVASLRGRGFYETRAVHTAVFEPNGTATVRVTVDRGPSVTVAFAGDPLPEDERERLVPVRAEGSADEDLLEDADLAIEDYLKARGYRDAAVGHTRAERDGMLTITFTVSRGTRFLIESVTVAGNAAVPAPELLRLAPIQRGQPFVQAAAGRAAAAMRDLYRSRGFTRAAVQGSAVVIPAAPGGAGGAGGDRQVAVRLTVAEGPRTLVGAVAFEGHTVLTNAQLHALMTTAAGRPYSEVDVAAARDRIDVEYRNRGYESVVVEPDVTLADNDTRADIRFAIAEGPQVIVDHVIIIGNTRTSIGTIERELLLRSGEPLGYAARLESQQRLAALGLFRRVTIDELPHAGESRRDILVQVEEAPPTTIGYGGGVEGGTRLRPTGEGGQAEERFEVAPRGFFEIGRRNLWGKNRAVNLFGRVSLRSRDVVLSDSGVRLDRPAPESRYGFNEYRVLATYREPKIFSTPADVLVTGILDQAIRSSFNFITREARAEAGVRIGPRYSLAGRYSFEHTRLFDERFTESEKPLIDRIFPQVRISKFSVSAIRDTRNDLIDPDRGAAFILDRELAARVVGSEVGFTRTFLQGFGVYRLPARRRIVLALAARLGAAHGFRRVVARIGPDGRPIAGPDGTPIVDVVEDLLPASERFFAGGDTTVRGFSLDRLGTAATISSTGFPTGGNGLVVLNAELRTSLVGSLGAAVFVDGGNVFLRATDFDFGQLRGAAGAGLRYRSPVGPIRIDLGFKLDRRELAPGRLERRSVLHISLGQAF
ncbi:MAG: BamA/TamA family outer membrane protein [Acidobacteria bacterium]|nr:BamA/TamA family outer membrane protein [Acidobacteriota bacterium]